MVQRCYSVENIFPQHTATPCNFSPRPLVRTRPGHKSPIHSPPSARFPPQSPWHCGVAPRCVFRSRSCENLSSGCLAVPPIKSPVHSSVVPGVVRPHHRSGRQAGAVVKGAQNNTNIECGEACPRVDAKNARRKALGLTDPEVVAFTSKNHFISLGCWCGVARSLKEVGLNGDSYPFDGIRIPVSGIMHCLKTDFEDFLTFTIPPEEGAELKVYKHSRWGGSFWYQNPDLPQIHDAIVGQIDQFLGFGSVPATASRIFVWAANSTREIEDSHRLLGTLKLAFPKAERVRLVVLIDLQSAKGPHIVDEIGEDIIFCLIRSCVFLENGKHFSMERCVDNYGEAIALATSWWSKSRTSAFAGMKVFPTLKSLADLLDQMDAGHTGCADYWPRRFQGQRLQLPLRSRQKPRGQNSSLSVSGVASLSPAPSLSGLLPPMVDVVVPRDMTPGSILETDAFGRRIRLQVPDDICGGQVLRLRVMEGVVSFVVVAAAKTKTRASAVAAGSVSASPVLFNCRKLDSPRWTSSRRMVT
eukprot:TRINITY_DN56839_c0_g1_i1.p1 TRINITY_DN56839_c0_g1~~TRINITY_DN56839_c0_g1_i1.p1  ORF type:complete len:528 (-),score=41.97 TRINITY_DN56839_c0_g1_i1:40-1623(-)